MDKLCECGCGNKTNILQTTDRERTGVRGEQARFVHGHNFRRHGLYKTAEYRAWDFSKGKCTNPNHPSWDDYGGRGIMFRFNSPEQWFAELGPRPSPKHSVDRINNDGNYEPGNVRWATRAEQNRNRRPSYPRIKVWID